MNTIRELKQQEKYKTMLKRKNKEKKIYKDKNASLQFEKQKLYRALLNREQEIERLNNIINEFDKWLDEESEKTILSTGHLTCLMMCKNKLQKLKGSGSDD